MFDALPSMPANSKALVCPACHGKNTLQLELVEIEPLAQAWVDDWPNADRPPVSEMVRRIRSDLTASQVRIMQCQVCKLEFSDPMKTWTSSNYPSQSHGLGFDQLTALQMLRSIPPCRILEIGCGCGEFLAAANAMGHSSTGVDFSKSSVEKARLLGVDARLMDLKELADTDAYHGSCDVIAMFQVIEHLEQPDALFHNLGKLATRSAKLFIGCPGPNRFTRQVSHSQRMGMSDFWDFPPQHPLRWNATAMTAFLIRSGWQVTSVQDEPFSTVAAAAQLVAIDMARWSGKQSAAKRRLATLVRRMELFAKSKLARFSGIRMFVSAVRAE